MRCQITDGIFLLFSIVGFNPKWNTKFQFDVHVPELALVRFVVKDHDSMSANEFVAQYTLPFNSLKMGEFMDICNLFHTVTQIYKTINSSMFSYFINYQRYLFSAQV